MPSCFIAARSVSFFQVFAAPVWHRSAVTRFGIDPFGMRAAAALDLNTPEVPQPSFDIAISHAASKCTIVSVRNGAFGLTGLRASGKGFFKCA